ncbi:MAG TPA: septal ring lytic transglycosylase RlpA family protein [Candidatus Acidoferrales bacterium]|nr:septal ring lytic transglycosylase RlpA family protein [Candidatus Acidoferrales bacterium]
MISRTARQARRAPAALIAALLASACAGLRTPPPPSSIQLPIARVTARPGGSPLAVAQTGLASWYGADFHGRKTASGEKFDPEAFTAAHPVLPLGTKVRVTRLDTRRSVVVEINDRGPFVDGRIIDLSRAAARALGLLEEGVAHVRVEVLLSPGDAAGVSRAN